MINTSVNAGDGNSIFDIAKQYQQMALREMKKNPEEIRQRRADGKDTGSLKFLVEFSKLDSLVFQLNKKNEGRNTNATFRASNFGRLDTVAETIPNILGQILALCQEIEPDIVKKYMTWADEIEKKKLDNLGVEATRTKANFDDVQPNIQDYAPIYNKITPLLDNITSSILKMVKLNGSVATPGQPPAPGPPAPGPPPQQSTLKVITKADVPGIKAKIKGQIFKIDKKDPLLKPLNMKSGLNLMVIVDKKKFNGQVNDIVSEALMEYVEKDNIVAVLLVELEDYFDPLNTKRLSLPEHIRLSFVLDLDPSYNEIIERTDEYNKQQPVTGAGKRGVNRSGAWSVAFEEFTRTYDKKRYL